MVGRQWNWCDLNRPAGIGLIAIAQEEDPQNHSVADASLNYQLAPTPVPGGTGFVSLSPFAFKPYSATGSCAYFYQALYNPGVSFTNYVAQVQLPDHASITKLIVYYFDNGPMDLNVNIQRVLWIH
jgi:hypothetical protein